MKTKQQRHFCWRSDPKNATAEAEQYARDLKLISVNVIRSDVHVWRDPTFCRTTVEWWEDR